MRIIVTMMGLRHGQVRLTLRKCVYSNASARWRRYRQSRVGVIASGRAHSPLACFGYYTIEHASPGRRSRLRGQGGVLFFFSLVLFVGMSFPISLVDVCLATRCLRGWSYSTSIKVQTAATKIVDIAVYVNWK